MPFLIYCIRKPFFIYDFAPAIPFEFPYILYEEKFDFFFISVLYLSFFLPGRLGCWATWGGEAGFRRQTAAVESAAGNRRCPAMWAAAAAPGGRKAATKKKANRRRSPPTDGWWGGGGDDACRCCCDWGEAWRRLAATWRETASHVSAAYEMAAGHVKGTVAWDGFFDHSVVSRIESKDFKSFLFWSNFGCI